MPLPDFEYCAAFSVEIPGGFVIDECCIQLGQPYSTIGAIQRLFGFSIPLLEIQDIFANASYAEAWGRDVHLKLENGTIHHSERVYPPLAVLVLACELGLDVNLRSAIAVWAQSSTESRANKNTYGGPPRS